MNMHVVEPHRPDTLARLSDRRLFRELAYVDGEWTAGPAGATFPVTDPATGAWSPHVPRSAPSEAERAVDAAGMAFPPGAASLPQERAAVLRRWHDLIVAARDDLAVLMVREQGKPIRRSAAARSTMPHPSSTCLPRRRSASMWKS